MFKDSKPEMLITTPVIQFTTELVKNRTSASTEQFPPGPQSHINLCPLTSSSLVLQPDAQDLTFGLVVFFINEMFSFIGNLIY